MKTKTGWNLQHIILLHNLDALYLYIFFKFRISLKIIQHHTPANHKHTSPRRILHMANVNKMNTTTI